MCSVWNLKNMRPRTPLVVQSIRIHLPMQGAWVWSLGWEDSACCEVTKSVFRSYWACTPTTEAHTQLPPSLCAATTETCVPRACAPPARKDTAMRSLHMQWRVAPLTATRENPQAAKKILVQPQEKFKKILKSEIWKNYLVIQPCLTHLYILEEMVYKGSALGYTVHEKESGLH